MNKTKLKRLVQIYKLNKCNNMYIQHFTRLKALLRDRLQECGWRDEITLHTKC